MSTPSRFLVLFALACGGAPLLFAGCGSVELSVGSNKLIDAANPDVICPDVCKAVCTGASAPKTPAGCPAPSCRCDGGVVDTSVDAGSDATAETLDPLCPATYALASTGDHAALCAASPSPSCVYPEGHCSCVPYCGGPPKLPGPDEWECVPKRTDGCPETLPVDGSLCIELGKSCNYGCCDGVSDCKAGKWVGSPALCP